MMSREQRRREDESYRTWQGRYRPYDLVKEFTIALGVIAALSVVLTILFSSPDVAPSTIKQWSRTDPVDFVTTALSELDGTSESATYGPPYNHQSGSVQHLWLLHPQRWLGVSHPINAPQDFVIAPLRSITGVPALQGAISTYQAASAKQQSAWTTAYSNVLGKAKVGPGDSITLPAGRYGPVRLMMSSLLSFAQGGGLDGALLTSRQFYQTDYTKPLLFMADGGLLTSRAMSQHLLGTQWGIMNETGSYPGQVWLWLYTFWYQIKPFSTSPNADIQVMAIMAVLSLALLLIPYLPVVNRIPRWIPIYRLIWRNHYKALDSSG